MLARVEWSEEGDREPYSVIAELNEKERWEFWAKAAFEGRWYPMETTSRLVNKANGLLVSRILKRMTSAEPA